MDEMWSFCHDKQHQIWLWWAVDHETNTPPIFESNSDTAIYVECSNCRSRTKSVEKSIDYTAKEIVSEIWNTRKSTLVNGSNSIK